MPRRLVSSNAVTVEFLSPESKALVSSFSRFGVLE